MGKLKIAASTYVKPEPKATENPYLEDVIPFTSQGLDTAFDVTFDAKDYASDKLKIQDAVRRQGFSARVAQTDYVEGSDAKTVTTTFLIRPLRKTKSDDAPETDSEDAPAE